jgi:UDP-N-acetylmuramyl pentapeptide phosphotransferase/UDP-N-acetylglucosamine-1-phosphate transferase
MINILIIFFTSFFITCAIIITKNLHGDISGDINLSGPQKFHIDTVPRIGGISIYFSITGVTIVNYSSDPIYFNILLLIISALPVIVIGIAEDITKKISPKTRLLFIAIGGLTAIILIGGRITRLDIPILDQLIFLPFISIAFTTFAIVGLTNSYNIIDGFNGLSSMVGFITLVTLGYVGLNVNDTLIAVTSFTMAAAILGFFVLNYPKGLIFLGDGGAYLIGFWISCLSIMLISRHESISPWFALMINAYPTIETVFSIYRRKAIKGKSPSHPDGIHFHTLIYRRIINRKYPKKGKGYLSANSMTSPYLWALNIATIIPAIIFINSTVYLITSYVIFIIFYINTYNRIVNFKTPAWMK